MYKSVKTVGPKFGSESSQGQSVSQFKGLELSEGCLLSKCCNSCSFCNFTRAASKEVRRSRSICQQNKSCQRCPLCKSIVFCPICSKCPTCCHRDQCWGKASKLPASLAKVGFKSQSGFGVERWVQSPFQGKATSLPLSLDCEQICKSRQEQGPFRSSCLPHPKEGSGKSGCQVIPGLLQPSFSCSQTQQQMASHFGFERSQSLPRDKNFQNGNSRDHTTVSTTRGMGHLSGFQRRVFSEIQKIPEVSFKQGQLSVQSSSLWFGNGPVRIHQSG